MDFDQQNLLQVSQELLTIRDYIRWAYSSFNACDLYFGHGTDNAWDEAVNLVLSALHLPPDASPDLLHSRLTHNERNILTDFIRKRIKERKPVAYLTHEAWFAGLPFYVDERVIIPRSPVAELIEKGFSPWLQEQEVHHILDLCTGSGCFAVACAIAFPESHVDAVDISEEALAVAAININKHHVTEQVRLIQGDLYQNITQKYHLIISNPPYVSLPEYEQLPTEYHHEPEIALHAAEEGIAIVKRILKGASHHLHPNGLLVVEVGNVQDALMEHYPDIPFIWLDFARGGEGVFALSAEQLGKYQHCFGDE
jgi:ribosomal protein L3 glutamine methyltransferase